MENQELQKGILALTAAFPGLVFNARLYQEALLDLDGDFFLMAVMDFIKTTKELYPGTNPIAILREKTLAIKQAEYSRNQKQLERETDSERMERWKREAVPMPADAVEALKKIGVNIGGAK